MERLQLYMYRQHSLHSLTTSTVTHSALTNECEVLYSDDYWGTTYCGGMGVVNQHYALSSSGSLSADHNGPIICANGEEYTGYTEFNEIVLQSNGSLSGTFTMMMKQQSIFSSVSGARLSSRSRAYVPTTFSVVNKLTVSFTTTYLVERRW